MFKVNYEACSYPNTIPLGVTQENTLMCIMFEKFWLMFGLNLKSWSQKEYIHKYSDSIGYIKKIFLQKRSSCHGAVVNESD